jgi:hypothetical protein
MFLNSFRDTVHEPVEHSPLDFCLRRHLKTLEYSAPTEKEEIFHQRSLMAVKTFHSRPGHLKGCYNLRSDVSMRALVRV